MAKKAEVVTMPAREPGAGGKKTVRCRQEEIDRIPPGTGDWRVVDVPGLYLRAGARERSFRLQRRVAGKLVTVVLGPMTAAEARRAAMKQWAALKPPTREGKITLAEAWARFLDERRLAERTVFLYRYNLSKYLAGWQDRTLEQIGNDRAGVRALCLRLQRERGMALASQVMRQLRAVYQYWRRVQPDLPETPTAAVDIPTVGSRNWALSPDELKAWWAGVQKLTPLKQVFWQLVLLTGCRRGSAEALRWQDVDLEGATIHFSTAKAGRTYTIPACRRLVKLLREWRQQCLPTEAGWVFPSPFKPEAHIACVRDDKRGVASAHHLRHLYRTTLAGLGCPTDLARLLLGHSLSGDVSRGYITPHLLTDALRPWAEAVERRYAEIL
ncbi:MAG: tyrosine-type recombinase/integrase, partial [Bryobacteraceae bacterium]|nr:tyrosine-type recombinase/integrase [Bryobacteraceae bacterium]